MIQGVHFAAMRMTFPAGKTQIARDNQTGKTIMFSDYTVNKNSNPPTVQVIGRNREVIATYTCHLVKENGRTIPVVDQLDLVGMQG